MIETVGNRSNTLASVKTMMGNDKEQGNHFSRAMHQEKHERIARNSLYDMFNFHDTLEKEIARIRTASAQLTSAESEILERMLVVQEHYLAAMKGFSALGAEMQQHALVRFSDALLDLMKLIQRHKGH